ncbi:indole-3-glycerol phosphate synthase TrpC [bacterium]|nr:indole-3-glycerol phosphate synthase TrpC [bacterium]MDY2884507.1 indole-3-glycerol phosphate synthase TrpC [Bariatricus sp.]
MILDKIAAYTRLRIEEAKKELSPDEIRRLALSCKTDTGFPFEKVLKEPGIHYICEVKKASPSKGVIAEDFPYLKIAEEYEKAGASAISCLTEPKYFMGKNVYLKEITGKVKIPVLRKDFTVDEYMIYEAKLLGASAVLLICAILDTETVRDYIHICDELGLSALVEVHDEKEMRSAIEAGARVIGVNNRNLKDFTVDIGNSVRLRKLAPPDVLFVAESGIQNAENIRNLKEAGVNGVLIGETLMRSRDKKAMLVELNGGLLRGRDSEW